MMECTKVDTSDPQQSPSEEDVFEITDFTTATDFERFTSRFEQLLLEWQVNIDRPASPRLADGAFCTENFQTTDEILLFANFKFVVTRHQLELPGALAESNASSFVNEGETKEDVKKFSSGPSYFRALEELMSTGNEFSFRSHCLVRWFGHSDFLTIRPFDENALLTDSQRRLVLSAVSVAVNNTAAHIPVFLQLQKKWQRFYYGLCETGKTVTDYEMIHLRRPPNPQFKYLAELLTMFKDKIGSPAPLQTPVLVSARFQYTMREIGDMGDDDDDEDDNKDVVTGRSDSSDDPLMQIPFGAVSSRISEMHLASVWLDLSEDVIVDTESHTDLNPLTALQWRMKIKSVEEPLCRLALVLSEFLRMSQRPDSVEDALATLNLGEVDDEFIIPSGGPSRSTPPQKSMFHISRLVLSRRRIQRIVDFMFPIRADLELPPSCQMQQVSVKACPDGSFLARLAPILASVLQYQSGLGLVAHIWSEIVAVIRARWETNQWIPYVEHVSSPNFGTCLLHQKLQLLNCCIHRARERAVVARRGGSSPLEGASSGSKKAKGGGGALSSGEEDEFYDCFEEAEAEGRSRELPNHKLVSCNRPLYVPVTQEPTPMTEDVLAEQADLMTQLGSDTFGSHMRARLQSASLLSDMEAFKAANPGCELADFVRWYSPRDWILEEGESEGSVHGSLSPRMEIEGSIWQETWKTAKPVPVKRQKRLFDDTKEALKVIGYLEKLKPGSLLRQLVPVLCLQAIRKIEAVPDSLSLSDQMKRALELLSQSSRQGGPYHEVLALIYEAEARITLARSVLEKVGAADEATKAFVAKLVDEKEVEVPGGPSGSVGQRFRPIFFPQMNHLPEPDGKEYLLRTRAPRPSATSRTTPQRMFCTITNMPMSSAMSTYSPMDMLRQRQREDEERRQGTTNGDRRLTSWDSRRRSRSPSSQDSRRRRARSGDRGRSEDRGRKRSRGRSEEKSRSKSKKRKKSKKKKSKKSKKRSSSSSSSSESSEEEQKQKEHEFLKRIEMERVKALEEKRRRKEALKANETPEEKRI
ncbi:unnamed protein product, partial [Cyprideis torosa]